MPRRRRSTRRRPIKGGNPFRRLHATGCRIAEIHAAWGPCPVPDAAGIVAPDRNGQPVPDSFRGHQTDAGFFRSWIGGLSYDGMVRHQVFDVEFIFHYLTPAASAYYLGGSLLYWAGYFDDPEDSDEAPAWDDEFPGGDIATIHLIDRLATPSWLDSIEPFLTPSQRLCTHRVMRLLLSYPPEEWTYCGDYRGRLEQTAAARGVL